MKLVERQGALAVGAFEMNDRIERGERHAHVGRMGGDAGGDAPRIA